jgi:hypothetical protein
MKFLNLNNYDGETLADKISSMAEFILNNIILSVNDTKSYRIAEIEFYLKHNDHNDEFVHGDPDQQVPYKFYFHKQNGKSYKGGTFKGLDITFKYKKNAYCGILLRSIYDIKKDKFIEGSCNCVTQILKDFNKDKVIDLVNILADEGELPNINCKLLKLTKSNIKKLYVASGPRVGLTLKKDSVLKRQFIMKNYRFCTFPDGKNMSIDEFVGKKLSIIDTIQLYNLF